MGEAASFLCSPFNDTAKGVLTARAKAYYEKSRSTAMLNWLTKRRAYITVSAGGASLSTPTGGGLGSSGLYTPIATKQNTIYRPDPFITSVVVDTAGELGSLREGKVSFTVNSKGQLDSLKPFFRIGERIEVRGGWSNSAVGYKGGEYIFGGTIKNFSFTLNKNGGFDCSTDFVGEGSNVLGASFQSLASGGSPFAVVAGQKIYYYGTQLFPITIQKYLEGLRSSLLSNKPTNTISPSSNIFANHASIFNGTTDATAILPSIGSLCLTHKDGGFMYSFLINRTGLDTAQNLETSPVINAQKYFDRIQESAGLFGVDTNAAIKLTYVTLSTLLALLEKSVIDSIVIDEFKIECEVQNIPTADPPPTLTSINTMECIFPGYAESLAYVNSTDGSFRVDWPYTILESNGAGHILISIDWLLERLKVISKERQSTDKNVIDTAFRIVNDIFDLIARNSGGFFKFTLVESKTTRNKFLVVNNNYVPKQIEYFTLKVQADGGIARDVSLVGKLPNEVATEAYVKARPGGTPNVTTVGNTGLQSTDAVRSDLKQTRQNPDALDWEKLYEYGITIEAIDAIKPYVEAVINANTETSLNFASFVPLELSLTVDGIAELEYGNSFTINYLPGTLTDPDKIFFMITKISQNFNNTGDWTTSIDAIMRVRPAGGNTAVAEPAVGSSGYTTTLTNSSIPPTNT